MDPEVCESQAPSGGTIPSPTRWKSYLNDIFWVAEGEKVFRYKRVLCRLSPLILGLIFDSLSLWVWYKHIYSRIEGYGFFRMCLVIFLSCYGFIFLIVTNLTDPGVVPWNWAIEKKRVFTEEELREGTAVNNDQFEWAKKAERPARACFSTRSGTYILRADHYCGWVNNWVGLKNHRYFLIAVTSLMLYSILFSLDFLKTLFRRTNRMSWLLFIFVLLYGGFFGTFLFAQFWTQFWQVTFNFTTLERLKGHIGSHFNGYNAGWQEVCGSLKYWPCWCCPFKLPRYVDGFSYEPYSDNDQLDDVFVCKCKRHTDFSQNKDTENNNDESKPLL